MSSGEPSKETEPINDEIHLAQSVSMGGQGSRRDTGKTDKDEEGPGIETSKQGEKEEENYGETFPNGDTYIGEIRNGLCHGYGTYIKANGDKYVGTFKNGIKHGHGKATWIDGTKYSGDWSNDKKHGQGTEKYPDLASYTGQWTNDQKNGQGQYVFPDGTVIVGQFQNGCFLLKTICKKKLTIRTHVYYFRLLRLTITVYKKRLINK